MTKRNTLDRPCWFFVSIDEDRTFGNLVVWARTKLELMERFQNNVKVVKVVPLSWRGLKELTGCSIPYGEEPDDFARREIMMKVNHRMISILPSIDV